MSDARFRHLARFMGGYLHQDWDLEYATLEDAVEAFRTEASQDVQEAVGVEIVRVLLSPPPNGLDALLEELGADIDPEPWGGPERLLQTIRMYLIGTRPPEADS